MEKKFQDKELGIITIRKNNRAKRYSIKIVNGSIFGVIPYLGTEKKILELIHENRQKLIEALNKYPANKEILNDKTELQTNTFKLHIFRTDRENYYMTLHGGMLQIACPQHTNFENEHVQQLLKSFIEKALRHEAKRILPQRLQQLAGQYKFTYSGLRINKSRTRWGSCNSKGNINLSYSLMLLPNHLIDYVLLHELCHTKEMNHSERFWKLMNDVTNHNAKELRKELKGYRML